MGLFALGLGLIALGASALFSGAETGFYRIPRIRLQIDAADGDRIARFFLLMLRAPLLFVATLLVGNNIANNLISMATVLAVQAFLPNYGGVLIEIGSTLFLAPLLFVYGEMFPKYIALNAPNALLRRVAPLLAFSVILFLPLTWFLWLISTLVTRLSTRGSRVFDAMALARNELNRALDEGRDVGVLVDVQRRLADAVFASSTVHVGDVCASPGDFPPLQRTDETSTALEYAYRLRLAELPVFDGDTPIGYVRTLDLELAARRERKSGQPELLPVRDFVEIDRDYSPLTAMSLFLSTSETLGCIVEPEHGLCVGLLARDDLRRLLFTLPALPEQGIPQA